MKTDQQQKDTVSCEETSEAIYDVVCDLLSRDVSASRIAAYLTHHATKLSFAACDEPTVIFQTILGAMLDSIPEKEQEFDQKLADQITHHQARCLAN
jgi:hypothetical protein